MKSETPQFDTLLDEALKNIVPHKRVCKWKEGHSHCEGEFEITLEDIEFLKMLRVPAPNFCPTCRRMRRYVYMGLSQLFKIECDAPNHGESMISILSPDCPFPVYDYKYFMSDEFDPFSFGRTYENNVSPLEQLFEMRKKFPIPSFLNRDPSSINCEYSNGGRNTKNGYYIFGCYGSEDVWYSVMAGKCKDVMDSRYPHKSEHIYDVFHSKNIYKSSFIYFSKDCTDSMFLFDCRNCDNCFGCVNLRNKKYCVWNVQMSQEDYEAFMKSAYPLRRDDIKAYTSKLWELVKKLPLNASRNTAVENVSGVMLSNTRNSHDVTESENSEHLRHADGGLSHNDSMDFTYSGSSGLLYGAVNVGSQSSNVKFSISCKFCTNSEFIFNSKNLDNCFMCFGLQNKSYCILNKQYTREEYFTLVDKIKCDMWQRGEYEDSLPMEFSAQAYNYSIANTSFPLTDDEIMKLGGYVARDPESNAGDIKTLSGSNIPQTIDEVTDDILNYGIICEVTGKPFRIIASELAFYRRTKLPIPSVHPVVRMNDKARIVKIGRKYLSTCANCGNSIYSVFDPKDNFLLYCEKCYQAEVY
ncbi:MAG: hypothetical protein WD963_00150 [Candidatus Paceibacterota bacterium]